MKATNIFFAIGVVAIVVMLLTFDVSWGDILSGLRRAGWWAAAVVLIWVPIYLINAWSWDVIINQGVRGRHTIPFSRVFRLTISGYALNYVTPVGVLGGEPYRIIELTPYLGAARATSSVILYVMMHIFSHFLFWSFGIALYLLMYARHGISLGMLVLLAAAAAFCALGIYFFVKGYRNGLAMKTLRILGRLPLVGRRLRRFRDDKRETIERIDSQIAALHRQNRRTFYLSLFLEFLARIVGCLELWFIFMVLTSSVSFLQCILIQAFTSLFANLLFFMPMEMGTREGGFALAVGGLSMSGAFGVLAGLLTRLRELIWVAIGILLMKLGGGRPVSVRYNPTTGEIDKEDEKP